MQRMTACWVGADARQRRQQRAAGSPGGAGSTTHDGFLIQSAPSAHQPACSQVMSDTFTPTPTHTHCIWCQATPCFCEPATLPPNGSATLPNHTTTPHPSLPRDHMQNGPPVVPAWSYQNAVCLQDNAARSVFAGQRAGGGGDVPRRIDAAPMSLWGV